MKSSFFKNLQNQVADEVEFHFISVFLAPSLLTLIRGLGGLGMTVPIKAAVYPHRHKTMGEIIPTILKRYGLAYFCHPKETFFLINMKWWVC